MAVYCRRKSTVAKRIALHKGRKLFSVTRSELLTRGEKLFALADISDNILEVEKSGHGGLDR
jgi:hypothetical protein